jgi:hypothetical protein
MLPTLDEFIARGPNKWPLNSYVREKGFKFLYVRWGRHSIGGELFVCLDLANAEVKHPGKGTFKKLITRLRSEYPEVNLYLENVLNEKLLPGLPRLGFIRVEGSTLQPDYIPPSFLLQGERHV